MRFIDAIAGHTDRLPAAPKPGSTRACRGIEVERGRSRGPADYGLPLEFNLDAYDELFPLVTVGNGDQIVVARTDDEDPDYLIYLDHEVAQLGGELRR